MLREEHITNGVTAQSVIDYVVQHHGRRSFRLTFKHFTTSNQYVRREARLEFNCTFLSSTEIEGLIDAFYQTPPPATLTLYSYLLYQADSLEEHWTRRLLSLPRCFAFAHKTAALADG